MSQGALANPTTGTLSGVNDVTGVNGALDALNTENSGSAAPANQESGSPTAGNKWLNTASSTNYPRSVYDGAQWLLEGAVDPVNHIWQPVIGGGAGSLAAATTTDLGSVPQSVVAITGTSATITGFGTSAPIGSSKIVRFASAGVVLAASANLILPGGSNITVQAGDYAFCSRISSTSYLVNFFRASGQPIGSSQASALFGDGSDGNLTISSGVVTLTRDAYYNNLTINGSGQLNTAGFRVFVAGILDLSSAPAAAIYAGPAAATVAYSAIPPASPATTTDFGQTPGAGGRSTSGNGHAPTTPFVLGGLGGAAGNSQFGSYFGGARFGAVVALPRLVLATILTALASMQPTGGGPGAGGADEGGAGAYGGLPVFIFAASINRGASTAPGAVQSAGGVGGGAGSTASGGGGGGGGGPVVVVYGALTGASATGALVSQSGAGGAGGSSAFGGQGGDSGPIMTANASAGLFTVAAGQSAPALPGTPTAGAGATTTANL